MLKLDNCEEWIKRWNKAFNDRLTGNVKIVTSQKEFLDYIQNKDPDDDRTLIWRDGLKINETLAKTIYGIRQ